MTPHELKDAMTRSWDHGASTYDQQWGHGLQRPQERQAWLALLRRLLPPSPPRTVLDVGAGTGFFALLLAELGHTVTALDLSSAMLDVLQKEASGRGLDITVVQGDAEAPPAGLGPFDAVVSRHVLWTLQEPEAAVRAWADLLVPGGQVTIIDGLWRSDAVVDRVLAQVGGALSRLRPRSPREHFYPTEARGRLPLQHLHDLAPARNVMARAGLVDVRAEKLTALDALERSVMPLEVRWQKSYQRYLLEGIKPG